MVPWVNISLGRRWAQSEAGWDPFRGSLTYPPLQILARFRCGLCCIVVRSLPSDRLTHGARSAAMLTRCGLQRCLRTSVQATP